MKQIRLGKTTLFQSSTTFSALVAALALLAGAAHSYGATNINWITTTGDFNTAANWDTGTVPSDGDQTIFDSNDVYTVNIAQNSPTNTDLTGNPPNGGGGSVIVTGQAGVVTFNIGPGVLWSITNRFRVGSGPNTNTIIVSTLSSATVYVAGGKLSVANGDGTSQIRIGDGTNQLGTMIVTSGVVVSDAINLGGAYSAAGKLVIVGPGVVTNSLNSGTLFCGATGSNNVSSALIITNGGKLFVSGETRIGATGSSGNLALISGPGSIWSNYFRGVRVGAGLSRGNMLIVSNGAKLYMHNAATIGGNGVASCNTAIVVGADSVFETDADDTHANASKIAIGTNAGPMTNNVLIVYDGATLICGGSLTIGDASSLVGFSNGVYMGGVGALSVGSAENCRIPSGSVHGFFIFSNTTFTTAQMSLNAGWTNTVQILSNATVSLANSVNLFPDTGPATNNINISGATGNSLIINAGTLIDVSGSNQFGFVIGGTNTFSILNGGRFITEKGTIGGGTVGTTGLISGVGSVWSNVGPFVIIGSNAGGSSNNLGIANGGKFYNAGAFELGNSATSTVNTVDLGGIGASSQFIGIGSNEVGSAAGADFSRMTVTNALLNCSTLVVGVKDSTNNLLELKRDSSTIVGAIRVRSSNTLSFAAGTLRTGGTTVDAGANSGNTFIVGDGVSAAVLELAGGFHDFNVGGLIVTNNATLRGSGTVEGSNATIVGTFSPHTNALSVGSIFFSNDVKFTSAAQLNYTLGTLSDSAATSNNLTLAGTLNVTTGTGFGANDYPIFGYSNLVANTLGVTPIPGFTASVVDDSANHVVLLHVTTAVTDLYTSWASHYFTGGGSGVGAGANDPDHDGVSNTNEFLSGFNPTNAAAYAHVISVAKAGAGISVTYLGASGDDTWSPGIGSRTNVLEVTTGAANGSYSNNFASTGVTNVLSGGHGLGTTNTAVDPNGATGTTRYYRIRVLAP